MPLNYTKINQEIDDLWEQEKNKVFNKLKVRIKLVEKFNKLEENLNSSNTNNENNDNKILLKEKRKWTTDTKKHEQDINDKWKK